MISSRALCSFSAGILVFLILTIPAGVLAQVDDEGGAWAIDWSAEYKNLVPVSGNFVSEKHLFFETDKKTFSKSGQWDLLAVDRRSGSVSWKFSVKDAFRTSNLLSIDKKLYFGLSDRRVVTLSMFDGSVSKYPAFPERHTVLLRDCGDKGVCAVIGDIEEHGKTMAYTPDAGVSPVVYEQEFILFNSGQNATVKRFPLHRMEKTAAEVQIIENRLVVIAQNGPIEVYDLAPKITHDPISRFELTKPDWKTSKDRLVWLSGNQLFVFDPRKPNVVEPLMLPENVSELLAYRYPYVYFKRKLSSMFEVWAIDVYDSSLKRIADFGDDRNLKMRVQEYSLFVLQGNLAHFVDLKEKQITQIQRMPWPEHANATPVALSKDQSLVLLNNGNKSRLISFIPPEDSEEGRAGIKPGQIEDKDYDWRVVNGLKTGDQFAFAQVLIEETLLNRPYNNASCGCLQNFANRKQVESYLAGLLKNRKKELSSFALNEITALKPKGVGNLLLTLYDAAQIKLGRKIKRTSKLSKKLAGSWPKGWNDRDLDQFASQIVFVLEELDSELTTYLHRKRLQTIELPYKEQLKSFRYLHSNYEREKVNLSKWTNNKFKWKADLAKFSRYLKVIPEGRILTMYRRGASETVLFVNDFPRTNSLWFWFKKRGKSGGKAYYSGQYLTPDLYEWLKNVNGSKSQRRKSAKKGRARGPIELAVKGKYATVYLNHPAKRHEYKIKLALVRIDSDRDGLTNYEEKALGTNSKLKDTDKDGIKDSLDANPLLSRKSRRILNNTQKIIQAIFFHESQAGGASEKNTSPFYGGLPSVLWIDWRGLEPVNIPSGSKGYCISKPEGESSGYYELKELDNKVNGFPPEMSSSDGLIHYNGKKTQAWVGLSHNKNGKSTNIARYHLVKIGPNWIVIDSFKKKD